LPPRKPAWYHHLTPKPMKLLPSRRAHSSIANLLLFVYVFFVSGCSFYRAKTLDPLNQEAFVEQMKEKKKYVILHTGSPTNDTISNTESAWHLKDIVVDSDNKKLTGVIDPLAANHQYYKTTRPAPKANRYNSKDYGRPEDKPIHEIHIYTTSTPGTLYSKVDIPFSAIDKVEVYDTHVGATVAVYAGATIAVLAALVIVVAATKSSCPFVYVDNGETYSFAGEMYGGAIYSPLERDDYLSLPDMQSVDGSYNLRISNELLERQYTNLAQLVVANHAKETEVILDKSGNIQTLIDPQIPHITIGDGGFDYSHLVALKDTVPYLFDEADAESGALSSLTMSFTRPADSRVGKLVLKAKNSFWLDFVYGKFNELFGMYYNTFAEQQKEEPADKLMQWSLDQNIPLSVYVETRDGWKFVDYFNSIGPLAWRDIVMPIDMSDVDGEEVKIKLQSGFMFWEVDYAAIDFSVNASIEVRSFPPASATDENGKNVAGLLSATDDRYLLQPDIGNVVTVTYDVPPQTGEKQTVFLHSRGYYEYIRDYENFPSITYLNSFKEKGAFTRFSRERYDAFTADQNVYTAALTQLNED
jgi:hypothetical protein